MKSNNGHKAMETNRLPQKWLKPPLNNNTENEHER